MAPKTHPARWPNQMNPTHDATLLALRELVVRARAPGPVRAALLDGIAEDSGLHPSSLERLVDLWLQTCTPGALGAIVAAGQRGQPAGTVGIVAPGNLCVAAWQPMCEALLCGNRVVVRPGSGDRRAPGNLADALRLIAPAVAARIAIAAFERGDRDGWRSLLARVDALSVHGSDAAVHALQARAAELGFAGPLRTHGHKFSMAWLPRTAARRPRSLAALAGRIAHDALLADGRGCMSARAVLIEGSWDESSWQQIVAAFERALRRAAARFAPGRLSPELWASRRLWIEQARFDAACDPGEVSVREDQAGVWALVARRACDRIDASSVGPGARALTLLPLARGSALPQALAAVRPHLAALSRPLATGAGLDAHALAAGFDRCCAAGRLQAPPMDQPPDGTALGAVFTRARPEASASKRGTR